MARVVDSRWVGLKECFQDGMLEAVFKDKECLLHRLLGLIKRIFRTCKQQDRGW